MVLACGKLPCNAPSLKAYLNLENLYKFKVLSKMLQKIFPVFETASHFVNKGTLLTITE